MNNNKNKNITNFIDFIFLLIARAGESLRYAVLAASIIFFCAPYALRFIPRNNIRASPDISWDFYCGLFDYSSCVRNCSEIDR